MSHFLQSSGKQFVQSPGKWRDASFTGLMDQMSECVVAMRPTAAETNSLLATLFTVEEGGFALIPPSVIPIPESYFFNSPRQRAYGDWFSRPAFEEANLDPEFLWYNSVPNEATGPPSGPHTSAPRQVSNAQRHFSQEVSGSYWQAFPIGRVPPEPFTHGFGIPGIGNGPEGPEYEVWRFPDDPGQVPDILRRKRGAQWDNQAHLFTGLQHRGKINSYNPPNNPAIVRNEYWCSRRCRTRTNFSATGWLATGVLVETINRSYPYGGSTYWVDYQAAITLTQLQFLQYVTLQPMVWYEIPQPMDYFESSSPPENRVIFLVHSETPQEWQARTGLVLAGA